MPNLTKKGKPKTGHKNPVLIPGVHRFGRSKMYHKKGLWAKRNITNPKKTAEKQPLFKEKPIGGDKNGKKRLVQLKKSKRYHPTAVCNKRRVVKRTNVVRRTRLRGSLTPGTVCIVLAGRYAGKRVVFLKQLESGLVLISGPFKINTVPLRRINQQYLIATSTKIDISNVKLPDHINDSYFARDHKAARKARKEQLGDIFATPKATYVVSDKRKEDQAALDKQLIAAIKGHPEKKQLFKYLSSAFWLRTGQYPHNLKF